jgi:hypothetical protein
MVIKAQEIHSITTIKNPYHKDMSLLEIDLSFDSMGSDTISELIRDQGEDEFLDEIDNDDIVEYVKTNKLQSEFSLEEMSFDVGEMLEYVLNNIGESGILDNISDEALKSAYRDRLIDEILEDE